MVSIIQASLSFPESYFDNFNLTKLEIENAKVWIKSIFDYKRDLNINDIQYGQLIQLAALSTRYPRIKEGMEYLETEFRTFIHPNWRPAYNLLFFSMSSNEISADVNTVSQVLFNGQNYNDIESERQKVCYKIRLMMREIFCLTQLIRTRVYANMNLVIQDLFNMIDKFNYIFTKLFGFNVAEFGVGGVLDPYRRLRNSIAHSHFVIDEGNQNRVKLVDWDQRSNTGRIIEYDLKKITNEMLYFVGLICQIIALFQLMWQSTHSS